MAKQSKSGDVLKHLQENGSITSWEAIQEYRATRLSAIIFNLRKRGYDIRTIMIDGTNSYGDNCKYAKYIYVEEEV